MAAKGSVLHLEGYNIETTIHSIIGRGAFGIVYRGKDSEGRAVAAKAIHTGKKIKLELKDLEKLTHLVHENVVRIFRFLQSGDQVWLMMELCEYGDLNRFHLDRNVKLLKNLVIMNGIAKGIHCLHSSHIIHRDIKPENILIASESPLVPKLTDFDMSKFLDQNYKTSAMSSNVGTLAFKAPEFFTRVGGKLRYHRNVDAFAAGLTFLAMIQAEEKRSLIPRIETYRDAYEVNQPIGALITERIKYEVKELNIVKITESKVTGPSTERFEHEIKTEIRRLIQKMTCVDPKERITAAQVQQAIEQMIVRLAQYSPPSRHHGDGATQREETLVSSFSTDWSSGFSDTEVDESEAAMAFGVQHTIPFIAVNDVVRASRTPVVNHVVPSLMKVPEFKAVPKVVNSAPIQKKAQTPRLTQEYDEQAEILSRMSVYGPEDAHIAGKIFIRSESGITVPMNVEPYDSIIDLKFKIQDLQEIPFEQQSLWYQGKKLEDGKTLLDYKIKKNSTVDLILNFLLHS